MENRVYASNQPKFKPSSSFTWIIVVVQSLSPIQIHYHCITCSSHGLTVFHCLLEFAKVHVHWVGDAMQPAISFSVIPFSCPQSFPAVFSSELAVLIKLSEYWSFSISPSNEHSGLISFRIDWFYLLAVQGTLKSVLQHHNLKASILWHSTFLMVQLLNPSM